MFVKYDYKQAPVKIATKKTNWGSSGSIDYPQVLPSVVLSQIRGKM
jgi:hypothetical protein